jgi:hypothetical protein
VSLEDIERRLRTLEDIEAIRDLHGRYIYWLNDRKWDEVVDCFTDDGIANIAHHGKAIGKAQLDAYFKEKIAKMNSGKGRDGHIAIQPMIQVNGDNATGEWLMYVFISNAETGQAQRWTKGKQDAQYVRINGQWKIKYIKFTRPWPLEPESVPKED